MPRKDKRKDPSPEIVARFEIARIGFLDPEGAIVAPLPDFAMGIMEAGGLLEYIKRVGA